MKLNRGIGALLLLTLLLASQLTSVSVRAEESAIFSDSEGTFSAFSLDLSTTYIFQGVASGGASGPGFDALSNESSTGHTVGTEFSLGFDTEQAGAWGGGTVDFGVAVRAGKSVVQRAGTVSVVNNDADYPNVVDSFDEETIAVTELQYTQQLSEAVQIYGGLLNTEAGDANEIAGSALSNTAFLNSALLYSLVEDATSPSAALGWGVNIDLNQTDSGSFSVFNTEESSGENPFTHDEGTTFSTEWTFGHKLAERSGAQVFGALYGINSSRTDINADLQTVVGALEAGEGIPETDKDTWSLYYNGYQYIDRAESWGPFIRLGVSDGDPNPIAWNVSGGLGGKGLFIESDRDRWGAGVFYIKASNGALPDALGLDQEIGGEVFYSLGVTSRIWITVDTQIINSAIPNVDTAWIVGSRAHFSLSGT